MMKIPPIIDIDGILVSSDILTECFCCDLDACKGICCVEGDAGAPVTTDEVMAIEDSLDTVWEDLSASAQAVIDRQGVAYSDPDGDLVTSIVGGKEKSVGVAVVAPDGGFSGLAHELFHPRRVGRSGEEQVDLTREKTKEEKAPHGMEI